MIAFSSKSVPDIVAHDVPREDTKIFLFHFLLFKQTTKNCSDIKVASHI